MKKFTLMLMAAFIAVAAFAAGPEKRDLKALNTAAVVKSLAKKQLPIANVVSRQSSVRKAPRRAQGLVTPPESAVAETYYTASGQLLVYSSGWQDGTPESIQVIVDGSDIYIAGLAYYVESAWIKGTIDGTTATFPAAQQVDEDESYPEWISGSNDGETVCDLVFNFDQEAGVLECVTTYIGECAAEDAFSVYAYWNKPTFTKEKPAAPEVVVLPEGVEAKEYVMTYDDGSTPVKVAVDGNDVYFQGMSSYCSEAWVKGTKGEDNTVTFPAMQYMGEYAGLTSYFFYNGETVFTYDPEKDTYTAEGQVFGVLGNQYYDGNYTNPVIAPVEEKAVMPANPEITGLEDSNYGMILKFNIPLKDVNGDPILASKLTYIIYTDVEKEVAPLTFTPATHEMLTEELTEIPYGFTENWDFYDTQIYLNDLYSEDWNKIGIQSIYYGGGETNATEIQWFDIKPYETLATFNFNEMDVPVSATGVTDGDITEETTLTEGKVSLTISTSTTSTPNRYWSTTAGPQLRVYGGTLTFSADEGYVIVGLEFNYNRWNTSNSADSGEFTDNADSKQAVWSGSAQTVVVTIAGNTQLNSINVILAKDVAAQTVVVSEAGYATVVAEQALDFTGLDVQAFTCEAKETYVHLDPITIVPAGTAVVVKAAAGSYDVPVTTEAGAEQYNDLVAATEAFVADGTQYILADGAEGVGFYKATPETTIAAGKGYIVKASSVKAFYGFDADDATGISGINAADENAVIYNVAGQRLSKAQKGINIINGKKVLK